MKFFFKADWKKYLAGCIVYTLFGVFCVFADGELNPLNATVRLADPETESEQAQNREELARQSAEIEKLKTENIQKQTENAQKTAEILKLKAEVSRLNGEVGSLKNTESKLRSEVSRLNGEVGSLKNAKSGQESEVSRLNGETDLLKRAESGLKAEVSRLKSEIGSLKNVESGLKAEVARLNGKRTELEQAESKLKSELFSEKKAKAGTEEKLRKKTVENSELTTLVRAKDAEGKRLETEKTSLKAEIAKLRTDVSKEKSELEAEKSLLEEKNQSLRRELLDTLERCAKLADRLKRLELSVAGVLDTLNPVYVGQRESELTDALDLVMQCGMRLAGTGTNVCDLLLPRLDKLGLSTVEKARIKVAQDELAAQNRAFARLSVPPVHPDGFRKCRILEVRDNEEIVVLNAGYRDGIRVNMTLKAPGETECLLRVIAVRPFVSGAVPEQGRLRDLSPGMEVLAPGREDLKKKQKN